MCLLEIILININHVFEPGGYTDLNLFDEGMTT